MSQVKEYKIDVPQAKIDRLMRRLDDTEYPESIEDGGWTYGAPVSVVYPLENAPIAIC